MKKDTAAQTAPEEIQPAVPEQKTVADDPEELQVELAKSMRRIISGVVKREA